MKKGDAGRTGREPIRYEIVVAGELGGTEIGMLEGMTVTTRAGRSTISGVVDQSHLHGVLEWLGDVGIELVSVRSVTDGRGTS